MNNRPLTDIINLLSTKKASSYEITEEFLKENKVINKSINALISTNDEIALEQAKIADKMIQNNESTPLTGVPIVHKDNLCTKDFPTTAGSRILKDFISPYNATVVQKTIDHGMVCVGKASCDEFAMGSSNETSYYGNVLNPYEHNHVPGGSSGGSAAAVAAGMSPLSTGSDTGGSVRQPASFCNLTGLKPTYGMVSRFGLIAFASSLDQVGPLAKTALDCGYLMNVISGYDQQDSTSANRPKIDFVKTIQERNSNKQYTIGIPNQLDTINFDPAIQKSFNDTVKELEKIGCKIKKIDLSMLKYAVPAYYVIAPAEASSNLARYNGSLYGHRAEAKSLKKMYNETRSEGFGEEVKRRILIGTFVLSKGFQGQYYQKALDIKKLFSNEFKQLFKDIDFILTPTTNTVPFGFNQFSDPVKMYETDALTIPANLVGLPAVSFQSGFNNSLPIGMQLIGDHFQDASLLELVDRFQKNTDWHLKVPGKT